jgi:hypothetical protein
MSKNEGYRLTPYISMKRDRAKPEHQLSSIIDLKSLIEREMPEQTIRQIINETKHHLNFKHQRLI